MVAVCLLRHRDFHFGVLRFRCSILGEEAIFYRLAIAPIWEFQTELLNGWW